MAKKKTRKPTQKSPKKAKIKSDTISAGDLKDQSEILEVLREGEELYRSIFDHSPDGIITVDLKGIAISCNPAFLELTGFSKEEIIGKHLIKFPFFRAKDIPGYTKMLASLVKGKIPEPFDNKWVHKNGTTRHGNIRISLLKKNGKIVGVQTIARDITERKLREEELRISEERYRFLIENANEGILVIQKGVFKFLNPKAIEILGYSEKELESMSFTGVIHPDDRAETAERIQKRVEGEEFPSELIFRTIDKEGKIKWVESNAVTINWEGEPAVMSYFNDVSDRMQAEIALRESEVKFKFIFDHNPNMMMLVDFETMTILDVNQAYSQTTGYLKEEVVNLPNKVGFTIQNEEVVDHALQIIRETGRLSDFGIELITKRGDEKSGLLFVEPFDFSGKQLHNVIFVDITERKLAESALTHSHDLMSYIIEHNRSAIAVHDRDLKYIYVSQRYLQDYKVEEHNVIGKHHYDVFPDLPQKWRDVHQKALAGEISSAEDDPYVREDGTVDWTRWECRPWYEADGSIGGLIVYTEVITERKRAEEELRESEEKYRALFERDSDAIFIYDPDTTNILDANDATSKMYGYDNDELIGMSCLKFSAEVEESAASIDKIRGDEEVKVPIRYHQKKCGAVFPVDVNGYGIELDGKSVMFAISKDITERKKAEEKILQLNKDLEQRVQERTAELSATIKEIESFSYSVSHDLRAPLRAMVGFSDILMNDYAEKLDDEITDYLSKIHHASKDMNDLITDLLALSQLSRKSLVLMSVAADTVATQVYKKLQAEAPEQEINFQALECPQIIGDQNLMSILLTNLISNSIKFASKERLLQIEFGSLEVEGDTAYYLRDNGIGFSMAYAAKLFVPFQRLHSPQVYEGTGIGLAISQRVIQRHKGKIWAESVEGKGTTIYFTIGLKLDSN